MSSVHKAFDTRIFYKECRSLAAAGYDVSYVVPHSESIVVDGVRIIAAPIPRNRMERLIKTVWSVYRNALGESADIYHFHDPELIPVAVLLKMAGKCVIYDIHEDLPAQIHSKAWIPRLLRSPVSAAARILQRIGVRAADGVATATPAIAARYGGIRTATIQNFPPLEVDSEEEGLPYHQRRALVVYHGGITRVRGAIEMVNAMEMIPRELDARLRIAGGFSPENLKHELECLPGWTHVDFLGWRSLEQLRELLHSARVGLVLFHPERNHVESQPNKLFEYMSVGIPIVASDFPLWREIVGGSRCGLLVNPRNPAEIAEAIGWLLRNLEAARDMGLRGREAVARHFNWASEFDKLASLYEGVLA